MVLKILVNQSVNEIKDSSLAFMYYQWQMILSAVGIVSITKG